MAFGSRVAADTKFKGAKPNIVSAGASRKVEKVEAVTKDMTLDITCDTYNITAVKMELAACACGYGPDLTLLVWVDYVGGGSWKESDLADGAKDGAKDEERLGATRQPTPV